MEKPARWRSTPSGGTSFYEAATLIALIFWAAILLGAILGATGTRWLIILGVICLALAAKTATDLILKRRP